MSKLKLDLHDIYNKSHLIDKALNNIIEEAIDKKIKLIYPCEKEFWDLFAATVNSNELTSSGRIVKNFKYEKGIVKVTIGDISFTLEGKLNFSLKSFTWLLPIKMFNKSVKIIMGDLNFMDVYFNASSIIFPVVELGASICSKLAIVGAISIIS